MPRDPSQEYCPTYSTYPCFNDKPYVVISKMAVSDGYLGHEIAWLQDVRLWAFRRKATFDNSGLPLWIGGASEELHLKNPCFVSIICLHGENNTALPAVVSGAEPHVGSFFHRGISHSDSGVRDCEWQMLCLHGDKALLDPRRWHIVVERLT